MMRFDEKLHLLCVRHGLNQSRLAARLGGIVSDSTVGNWFLGKTIPSLPVALQLARLFGVPLEYLADDAMNEPPMAAGVPDGPERIAVDLVRALGLKKDEVIRRLAAAPDPASESRAMLELETIRNRLEHFHQHLIAIESMQRKSAEVDRSARMSQATHAELPSPPHASRAAQSYSAPLRGPNGKPCWLKVHQMQGGTWIAYIVDEDGGAVSGLFEGPDYVAAFLALLRQLPGYFPNIPSLLDNKQLSEWLVAHPEFMRSLRRDDSANSLARQLSRP